MVFSSPIQLSASLPLMPRFLVLVSAAACLFGGTAQAQSQGYIYGGGWVYEPSGSVTNRGEALDLEQDLNLKGKSRRELGLGFSPAAFGWLPGLDFNYVRIVTKGTQTAQATTDFGTLPIVTGETIANSSAINDFDASIRWPYDLGKLRLSGGFTVAHLDGDITVSNPDSGASDTLQIRETFPLASLGLRYTPVPSVVLSARGDYVRYEGNQAHTWEASVLWNLLGPVGLEAGWRERRFLIDDGSERYDTRLKGARIALRMSFP